jgi:hypothetical protein
MIETFFKADNAADDKRSKLMKSQRSRLFFCKNPRHQSHSQDSMPEFASRYFKQLHMLLWQIQIPRSGTNQNAEPSVPISASFKIVPLRDVDCAEEPQACPRVSITEPWKGEKKENCFAVQRVELSVCCHACKDAA